MKEYLDIVKNSFNIDHISISNNHSIVYFKDKVSENCEELCKKLCLEIKNNYKNYLLPFNNNFKLFESIINSLSNNDIDNTDVSESLNIYKNIESLYSNNENILNKELEIDLYTNLLNLSFITSSEHVKYFFNLIENKHNLLLLTNYIFDNELTTKWDTQFLNRFFDYILQIKILFKDENSYICYIINFINKLMKEEKDHYFDESIDNYLLEFMYMNNVDDKLLEEIKEKENSMDYKNLIENFNAKEEMSEKIEVELENLNNDFATKIEKLKQLKERLVNVDSKDISFYDKNASFSEIDYENVKDYILYLIEYQNKYFNNSEFGIFDIIKLLFKEKSIFIDTDKESLIFNTINDISNLLNTEIIKINYSDIDMLKTINLDNSKKYLICITLEDEHDVYQQSDILGLEDKFASDNFKFIYINYNRKNDNTFYNGAYYIEINQFNKDLELFIENVKNYINLTNEQLINLNKYYESKLFSNEEIFELLFKNIEINNSLLNNYYDDELTKSFINYLINNKINSLSRTR